MKEKKRQENKEKAVFLALQKDVALIRRGLRVYGMKKDGSTFLIIEGKNYEGLWQEALEALSANQS